MRKIRWLLLAALLASAAGDRVRGQCWGAGQGAGPAPPAAAPSFTPSFMPAPAAPAAFAPPAPPPSPPAPRYEWRDVPGTGGDQEALLEYGRQVGAWSYKESGYRALLPDGTWGPLERETPDGWRAKRVTGSPAKKAECRCPKCEDGCSCRKTGKPCGDGSCLCVVAKAEKGPEAGDKRNFGMDHVPGGTRYLMHDGKGKHEVTRRQAMAAVSPTASDIPDDSGKFRLVCVGDPAWRKRVLADAASLPPGVRERVLVHAYEPGNAIVKQLKIVDSQPTVHLLAPGGRSLGRNLAGTYPAGLPQIVERIVKEYDPNKDPDLKKPDPKPEPEPKPGPGGFDLSKVPGWAWAGVSLALVLLLTRKKGGP